MRTEREDGTAPTDATTAPAPDPFSLLFSQDGADTPHEAYRALRERCPVARAEFAGAPAVFLTRYADVLWAMRHPEVFSSAGDALDLGGDQPLIPLQVDPPAHTRYRRLLNPEFVPRKVAELEADVRALARGLVDGFANRGHCDFHEEFATPLPSTVFLRLMGLPQSDLPQFLRWRDDTVRPDVPPVTSRPRHGSASRRPRPSAPTSRRPSTLGAANATTDSSANSCTRPSTASR